MTKYLGDHPGGPEIMLDFAGKKSLRVLLNLNRYLLHLSGKDADGMFEDIGHSSTARDILKKYLIGDLKVFFVNIVICSSSY